MTNYTIQQWIEDYDYVVRLPHRQGATPIGVRDQARDYFYSKYQDNDSIGRFARFQKAMLFLDQHLDDLSFGRAAVAGEKEALVGEPLVTALHGYFASLPSEQIGQFPTVEQIKTLARKHGA